MEIRNEYFRNFFNTACQYDEAKEERKKERKALIEADDWDGVKAFDQREEKEFPNPFTRGQYDAFNAYRLNAEMESQGFFEVNDLPWEKDLDDFLKALRDAGIQKILVTDQSTGLMDGLFALNKRGCKVIGLATYTRVEDYFGTDKEIEVRGIEVALD